MGPKCLIDIGLGLEKVHAEIDTSAPEAVMPKRDSNAQLSRDRSIAAEGDPEKLARKRLLLTWIECVVLTGMLTVHSKWFPSYSPPTKLIEAPDVGA